MDANSILIKLFNSIGQIDVLRVYNIDRLGMMAMQ
jgi:hypothetical protein